ncbi:MAG: Fic family protein [Prevotellaceae bacterium]|jgi:Fic family protein|nr:Fic family protein [Prevotellaceae bacterium]
MNFKILTDSLLDGYTKVAAESPLDKIERVEKIEIPVDYFQFYKSVSSVYSSKIEGEDIEFDSYFKHKFLKVKFKPDYTRKADDLYSAYDFIESHKLTLENVQQAHAILSKNLLPKSQQGLIRTNPMFVINSNDKIEYVAAEPAIVKQELDKLFYDVNLLANADLNPFETFYYAAFVHLAFVKIHPFQDGNGRAARLLEKWFLLEKIGQKATCVQLEKNYYKQLPLYYANIKKLGLEYDSLEYSKSLDFLLMTILGIDKQE